MFLFQGIVFVNSVVVHVLWTFEFIYFFLRLIHIFCYQLQKWQCPFSYFCLSQLETACYCICGVLKSFDIC